MNRIYAIFSIGIVLCLAAVCQQTAQAQNADHEVIELTIAGAPVNAWSKSQLQAKVDSGHSVTIRAVGRGKFNDSSFWEIPFNRSMPYGRKELSFRIDLDPAHKPLWGPKLLQLMIDGSEADAAVDQDGRPSFEKVVHNGQGYIPARSATVHFVLPKDMIRLPSVGFKTAGADNFHVTLSEFKVKAWPEADVRVFPQRLSVSELTYGPADANRLIIEWHDDEDSLSADAADISVSGLPVKVQ